MRGPNSRTMYININLWAPLSSPLGQPSKGTSPPPQLRFSLHLAFNTTLRDRVTSGDGNADSEGVWSFHNPNMARPKNDPIISITKYMSLHFNKLHYVVISDKHMKFVYFPVLKLLKKIQKVQKLVPPLWPDSRYKNNKDLFIGGDLQEAVNCHGSRIGNHMHLAASWTPSRQPNKHRSSWWFPRSLPRVRQRRPTRRTLAIHSRMR